MAGDLVERLEIVAKIHEDMTGKGNVMAATIREAASALRSSGEAVLFAWYRDRPRGWDVIVDSDMSERPDPAKMHADGWQPLYTAPRAAASAWRPIAEAPRDVNSPLLVHCLEWDAPAVCNFIPQFNEWCIWGDGGVPHPQPTHFQALPPPLASTSQTAADQAALERV